MMPAPHHAKLAAFAACAMFLFGCPSEDANNTNNTADQGTAPKDMTGQEQDMTSPVDMQQGADMRADQDMGGQDQGQPDQGQDMAAQDDMSTQEDMSQPQSGPLRLATWNISYLDLPGQGDRYQRTADDYVLLSKYVARLDADIVALQEVRGVAAVNTIFPADAWEAICEDRSSSQNVCFALRKASGWSAQRQPDVTDLRAGNPNLRAGLDLILTHPDHTTSLRLLNVHLKADCYTGNTAAGCPSFFTQITALETWIDARAEANEAFAVVGDFNRFMTTDDAAWLELDDMMPAGAALTRAIATDNTPCWGGMFSNYIDHIILGTTTNAWLKASEQLVFDETDFDAYYQRLSDHCPIWADLDIP